MFNGFHEFSVYTHLAIATQGDSPAVHQEYM